MDRVFKNICNMVKMINQRRRAQPIKKIVSLAMALPRADGVQRQSLRPFATANRRTFARFPYRDVAFLKSGISV